jgi:hypothetical protein
MLVLLLPLKFAAVEFSHAIANDEDSSVIVTSSATGVTLLNVMLSLVNVVSLGTSHDVSMMFMVTPPGALII